MDKIKIEITEASDMRSDDEIFRELAMQLVRGLPYNKLSLLFNCKIQLCKDDETKHKYTAYV